MYTPGTEKEQFEKIRTLVYPDADSACRELAKEIKQLIEIRRAGRCRAVLGLATGSTPTRLYRELIRLHKEEGLSFHDVITFNLDEYYGLGKDHPESYNRFMREQLFDHIDIKPENTHVPDGTVGRKGVFAYCQKYEQMIAEAGGLDLQVLGIGRTGHIGFNEPGSGRDSPTRLVNLDTLTRMDAARDFLGMENVPMHAITMGVGTILNARKVVLLAWGEGKAEVVAKAVEQAPVDSIPASFLQAHKDARFFLDQPASGELTRIKHPWLVGTMEWDPKSVRKAINWLSAKTGKSILKLLDEDYNEQGLGDLLTQHGPAYTLNIKAFNDVQHTLTGWPGGKPNADDSHRPERAAPYPKRVLILAPEPHDELQGMGGTIHRLVDQGHDVNVAYLTSGNLAVPEGEAIKATELILDISNATTDAFNVLVEQAMQVREELLNKGIDSTDSSNVRKIKAQIRKGEARAACQLCYLQPDRLRFLDLPFYETGRYRQFKLAEEDVNAVSSLLTEIAPHQVYITGNQADPSSVQALCFETVRRALDNVSAMDWFTECYIWLYRSIGREWDIHEIDMAVPLSPDELTRKSKGIYQHQTQRSQIPVSGSSSGESWQQAQNADIKLAELYDSLGMAEYEAIEGFRRYEHPVPSVEK